MDTEKLIDKKIWLEIINQENRDKFSMEDLDTSLDIYFDDLEEDT